MKEFFADLFAYHHHLNQKLATLLLEKRDHLPERVLPLFSHSLNAHQIWNSRILNTKPFGVHQAHAPESFQAIDQANYEDTLGIIQTFDLAQQIKYQNSKGQEFSNSVQEILFHTANHFTHHRAQIMSDLRQAGIEPIITDYIFYKR
ncbi:MAG: damage-inducible protein DinB [Bacteroidia bacterium]|nr:damage-inducible protein DinB [Bacteroidia bacterium]